VRCDRCGAEQPRYRSCGDRHCPQCQGRAREAWCERQRADQLPVPYFHLVFTLPHRLDAWVQSHPEVIYRALFRSTWATLDAFARNPKPLGGQLGLTGVLHTWGQNLRRHVHLYCLVPGGALSKERTRVPVKGSYLFPVKALSRRFRGQMVSRLRRAIQANEFAGIDPGEVSRIRDALMAEEWVVYAKPCLQYTESVIGYLARYTHRIAISNARILGLYDDQVSLSDRDYRDGQHKTLTLDAPEFIRRFLLHVLPKWLMRVRHYGCWPIPVGCSAWPISARSWPRPSPSPRPSKTTSPSRAGPVRCAGVSACARCAGFRRVARLSAAHPIADEPPTPRLLSLPTE